MASGFSESFGVQKGVLAPQTRLDPQLADSSRPHILLMGTRKSGKTSIRRVLFEKQNPHATLVQPSSVELDRKIVCNGAFLDFEVWDVPGDYKPGESLRSGKEVFDSANIFGNCIALVFVIDALDQDLGAPVAMLLETVEHVMDIKPQIEIQVFIHKTDSETFPNEKDRMDLLQRVRNIVRERLRQSDGHTDEILNTNLNFHLTNIFDYSIYEAFSKVVRGTISKVSQSLDALLNFLNQTCGMYKVFLLDVVSKIYIATDSSEVELATYQLCSEMIDMVIDVACIYGTNAGDAGSKEYNDKCESAVHVNVKGAHFPKHVVYLLELDNFMALACVMREATFSRKALVDYNIHRFKDALQKIVNVNKMRVRSVDEGYRHSNASSSASAAAASAAASASASASTTSGY